MVPTYERAALVVEAVASVLGGTFEDLEVLVVDDGSTDDTGVRVQALAADDPRVRYVKQENGGASSARNRGLDLARGAYVAFLDSDDLYLPGHLASQVRALEANPEADVVLCDARYEGGWKEDGQTVFGRRHFRPPVDLCALLDGAWVLPSTLMARRARIGDVRFDESYRVCEDLEWLCHLYAAGLRGVLNPEVLTRYRRHGAQANDDDEGIRLGTLRVLEAYADHAGRVGARLHRYQVERRRATHLVKTGRWREARPHLGAWLRRRFSSRAFRWWLRSLLARRRAP